MKGSPDCGQSSKPGESASYHQKNTYSMNLERTINDKIRLKQQIYGSSVRPKGTKTRNTKDPGSEKEQPVIINLSVSPSAAGTGAVAKASVRQAT